MKCAIARKNRDRRSGHKTAMPSNHRFGNEASFCTPVERELIKRISKKKMRRQHKMTQQAVNQELDNDWTWQDYVHELELQEMWYDDDPYMVPYIMEELDWPYDDVDDDPADYSHDTYPMLDW